MKDFLEIPQMTCFKHCLRQTWKCKAFATNLEMRRICDQPGDAKDWQPSWKCEGFATSLGMRRICDQGLKTFHISPRGLGITMSYTANRTRPGSWLVAAYGRNAANQYKTSLELKVAQGRPRGWAGMRARLTGKPYKTFGKSTFPAMLQIHAACGRVQASRVPGGKSMTTHWKTLVKLWFPVATI